MAPRWLTRNRLTSLGLSLLVVLYAAVLVYESHVYRKWDAAANEQARLHAELTQSQYIGSISQQLLRRMAFESQSDTAIAEILKRNGIRVMLSGPPGTEENQAPASPAPAYP